MIIYYHCTRDCALLLSFLNYPFTVKYFFFFILFFSSIACSQLYTVTEFDLLEFYIER